MTTAQSLPRTPTEVILAAVMALKAYSDAVISRCPEMKLSNATYRLGRDDPDPRRWLCVCRILHLLFYGVSDSSVMFPDATKQGCLLHTRHDCVIAGSDRWL